MTIYVGNLNLSASETELRNLFNHFGEVSSVIVFRKRNGQSDSFGYVSMKGDTNGIEAVERLNGVNYMNQFLEVYAIKRGQNT